ALVILALTRRERVAECRGQPAAGVFGATRSSNEPQQVQLERAHEPGSGRKATAPWQIPLNGWKDILWRAYQQASEDRLIAVAAGFGVYVLLASFPVIAAFVSLYCLFARAATLGEHMSLLSSILPAGAFHILQEQVGRIAAKGDGKLSFGFALGVGLALWSAN